MHSLGDYAGGVAGFHFLDLGVVNPWHNVSYLHGCRSGENHCVWFFPGWFQHAFGYMLDPEVREKKLVSVSEDNWASQRTTGPL